MSTKKEKLNFENLICKLPHCKCMQQFPCSNHHYSDECFSTNDHSKSESIEWEKEFEKNRPRDDEKMDNTGDSESYYFGYKYTEIANDENGTRNIHEVTDWGNIKTFISQAITTAVEARERVDENTSDGYHTFKELYEFRKVYNAVLFNEWAKQGKYNVHKSLKHSDGEDCFGGGWFIVTATLPSGQISNHYELKDWKLFRVDEHVKADEWDGHTAQDVVARLLSILKH